MDIAHGVLWVDRSRIFQLLALLVYINFSEIEFMFFQLLNLTFNFFYYNITLYLLEQFLQ